jgi:hypothetical protein
MEAWLSGAVSDASAGWTAEELADHVRGEFSTYSWLLDVMLDRTGFEIVDRSFRRSAYGTYTCTRRGSEALGSSATRPSQAGRPSPGGR